MPIADLLSHLSSRSKYRPVSFDRGGRLVFKFNGPRGKHLSGTSKRLARVLWDRKRMA